MGKINNYPSTRKEAPTVPCPYCEKTQASRGLFPHMRLAHPREYYSSNDSSNNSSNDSSNDSSNVTQVKNGGQLCSECGNSSSQQVIYGDKTYCSPECMIKSLGLGGNKIILPHIKMDIELKTGLKVSDRKHNEEWEIKDMAGTGKTTIRNITLKHIPELDAEKKDDWHLSFKDFYNAFERGRFDIEGFNDGIELQKAIDNFEKDFKYQSLLQRKSTRKKLRLSRNEIVTERLKQEEMEKEKAKAEREKKLKLLRLKASAQAQRLRIYAHEEAEVRRKK